MENTQDVNVTPGERTEQVRDELFRILDELVTGRGDPAAALTSRFRALWKQVSGEDEPTVH